MSAPVEILPKFSTLEHILRSHERMLIPIPASCLQATEIVGVLENDISDTFRWLKVFEQHLPYEPLERFPKVWRQLRDFAQLHAFQPIPDEFYFNRSICYLYGCIIDKVLRPSTTEPAAPLRFCRRPLLEKALPDAWTLLKQLETGEEVSLGEYVVMMNTQQWIWVANEQSLLCEPFEADAALCAGLLATLRAGWALGPRRYTYSI